MESHEPPEDPEDRARWLSESPPHRLAYRDLDFLERSELRGTRLGLEYLKPQLGQRELGIESTVVVFGSARTPSPELLEHADAVHAAGPDAMPEDPYQAGVLERARKHRDMVRYYEDARWFASLAKEYAPASCVITTGGGPGIMEAANRGAHEAGCKTMAFNIQIAFEQVPNPYITPELCFNFHYFAIRKMHFLLKAKALVVFPGGFGTLDELFTALTLIQTLKMPPLPIIMMGGDFWRGVVNFDTLIEVGTISPGDIELLSWADTAEEAWEIIQEHSAAYAVLDE